MCQRDFVSKHFCFHLISLLFCFRSKEVFDAVHSQDKASEDFKRFCLMNRLHYMIRSHSLSPSTVPTQLHMSGNKCFFDYNVLSLFSGSNLHKMSESATSSVAMVNRNQIRIIRVETFLKNLSNIIDKALPTEQ